MKTLMRTYLFSALLALPVAASAQTDTAPKADAPKAAGGMMMNCPMMAGMSGMQKDIGSMMSDVEGMMKDTKDDGTKVQLQRMHDRMAAMMVNMQKMGGMSGMMGNMMGGATMQGRQQPAAPAEPTAPTTPPAAPEDHEAHHPGQ